MSLLVLVSPRADGDPVIRRVKQRGVPYVILRPALLFDLLPHGVEEAARDHTVLIGPEVAAAIEGAIPAAALVEAVLDAVSGAGPQGRIIDIAPSPLTRLPEFLERVGAKPRTAGGLRSRIGRLFGQPTARLSGATVIIDGLAPEGGAAHASSAA